jgi:hypothetical protein
MTMSPPAVAAECAGGSIGTQGDDVANKFNTACGQAAIADGDVATVSPGSSAYGNAAKARATGSVAIGSFSLVDSDNDNGIAIGRSATVTGSATLGGGIAIGQQADVVGEGGIALGWQADSKGFRSIAIGRKAGEDAPLGGHAIAMGTDTDARGSHAIAIGGFSDAFGSDSTAVGWESEVGSGHTRSTALGAFATTTRPNQVVLGTDSESYTLPGLPGDPSRSFQSGPLEVVTTDADGNLASDGGETFGRIDENQEGVAIAIALSDPDLFGGQTFAIKANGGYFEGSYAVGVTVKGLLVDDIFGGGGKLTVSGGAGYGVQEQTVGGRASIQLGW